MTDEVAQCEAPCDSVPTDLIRAQYSREFGIIEYAVCAFHVDYVSALLVSLGYDLVEVVSCSV